jgi:hypothetical protein
MTVEHSGELTCFANDVSCMYWNNWGHVELFVEAVRAPSLVGSDCLLGACGLPADRGADDRDSAFLVIGRSAFFNQN